MTPWTHTAVIRHVNGLLRHWEYAVKSAHPDGFPISTVAGYALTRRAAERRAHRLRDRANETPWTLA